MIEEEPAVPADEVETADDSGEAAQAGAGTWALPEAGTITACPKCRGMDDGGVLHITWHWQQVVVDSIQPIEEQIKKSPCVYLDWRLFPDSGRLGLGGEHLCVRCTRCGFGWAEQTATDQNLYWHQEGEG